MSLPEVKRECLTASGGPFLKLLTVESPPYCVGGFKAGTKRLHVFGTKGGLNAYADLTEEECWLLADVLLEGVENVE